MAFLGKGEETSEQKDVFSGTRECVFTCIYEHQQHRPTGGPDRLEVRPHK